MILIVLCILMVVLIGCNTSKYYEVKVIGKEGHINLCKTIENITVRCSSECITDSYMPCKYSTNVFGKRMCFC